MISMKTAIVADIQKILKIIKQMNVDDLKYLRYQEESDPLIPRLIKNINEKHVLLFLNETYDDTEIFGFLEYEPSEDNKKIWVCSLYLKPEYRNQGYARALVESYRNLSEVHKVPIMYRTHETNEPMMRFTRFIKGHVVTRNEDGHLIIRVGLEDLV